MIAIHAYGVGDLTKDALAPYVQKAQNAGKKLIMQEWGMCYFDTSNNNCPKGTPLSAAARDANIKKYADNISQAGIPWMYWQIIPNADPHDGYDYEVRTFVLLNVNDYWILTSSQVGIDNVNWGALKASAQVTRQYASAFDFSKWLP